LKGCFNRYRRKTAKGAITAVPAAKIEIDDICIDLPPRRIRKD
jgi:hypothetical protein